MKCVLKFLKAILNKEEGFTFIEALLSLFITTLIVMLMTTGIAQFDNMRKELNADAENINHRTTTISGERQIEWHLFLNQLEHFLEGTINPIVTTNLLIVDEWDEQEQKYREVRYLRPTTNRTVLIRRVNGGTHYLLLGAHRVKFAEEGEGWLVVTNSFKNGEEFKGKIFVESWVKNKEEE